jgi:hypothetical protein
MPREEGSMRMDFADVQAMKRKVRDQEIDRLQCEAQERGEITDRMFWTMVYDFERAPWTTNRRQLAELGVEVSALDDLVPDEVPERLRLVIEALGRLNVFLLHTDHLGDVELYRRLSEEILDEEIRDIPVCPGVREYIDLIGSGAEAEEEIFLRHYASEVEREAHRREHGSVPRHESPPFDRDRHLPRPEDGRLPGAFPRVA